MYICLNNQCSVLDSVAETAKIGSQNHSSSTTAETKATTRNSYYSFSCIIYDFLGSICNCLCYIMYLNLVQILLHIGAGVVRIQCFLIIIAGVLDSFSLILIYFTIIVSQFLLTWLHRSIDMCFIIFNWVSPVGFFKSRMTQFS